MQSGRLSPRCGAGGLGDVLLPPLHLRRAHPVEQDSSLPPASTAPETQAGTTHTVAAWVRVLLT